MTFIVWYVSCLEEMVKLLRRVRTLRHTYYNLQAFNGVHFRAYAILFHLFGVSLLILFISFATTKVTESVSFSFKQLS